MAIKAEFLSGATTAKTQSLYQWDYGQVLEIESLDLPTLVEVHFACQGMNEAIVHVCSVNKGVATVTIPDRCLEQSTTITAWVYEIEGSTGCTTKTITIPVIPRTRPNRSTEVPEEVGDQYTELISEVNEAVGKLVNGDIMVALAAKATSADRATQADNASSAAHAESVAYATRATTADTATTAKTAETATTAGTAACDSEGNPINTRYATFKRDWEDCGANTILGSGMYQFRVKISETYCYAILPSGDTGTVQTSLGWVGNSTHYVLRITNGTPFVDFYGSTSLGTETDAVIQCRLIN